MRISDWSSDVCSSDLIETTARVRPFVSNNVIAKLPGAKPDGKAVLFLGHWDHLGVCAPDDPKDRICNGAVDNASGIAVLIEVAKRLANGPRSEERRVGQERVSTWRSRGSPEHAKKKR